MHKIRRGRASDAIFSIALGARYHFRPRDGVGPKVKRVRVVDVYQVFSSRPSLRMMQVEPGLVVIVLPNKQAFEHYEVFT